MDDMGMDVTMETGVVDSVSVDAVAGAAVDAVAGAAVDAAVNDFVAGGGTSGAVAGDGVIDAVVYDSQNVNASGYMAWDPTIYEEEQNWLGLGLTKSEVLGSGGVVAPVEITPEMKVAESLAKRFLQEQAMNAQFAKEDKGSNLSDNAKGILDGIMKARLPEPPVVEMAPIVPEIKLPVVSVAPITPVGTDMSDSMLP